MCLAQCFFLEDVLRMTRYAPRLLQHGGGRLDVGSYTEQAYGAWGARRRAQGWEGGETEFVSTAEEVEAAAAQGAVNFDVVETLLLCMHAAAHGAASERAANSRPRPLYTTSGVRVDAESGGEGQGGPQVQTQGSGAGDAAELPVVDGAVLVFLPGTRSARLLTGTRSADAA